MVYRKVCGSCVLNPVTIRVENQKETEIKPAIGTGDLVASLGSTHTSATKTISYNMAMCVTCRNLDPEPLDKEPMKVIMSDYDKIVIIPYRLGSILSQCEKDEITFMVRKYRNRFEKIFQKWQKSEQNKCKSCRIGEKIKINVSDVNAYCWIIIECTDVCYIRLSYGGGKIICP